jgi:trehalose 6-phosphate phosphatase
VFAIALRAMLAEQSQFRLLAGQMLWEVRPDGADKGSAVRSLMARPPFAGRLPVFVGDDVTDADGIAAAEALGGAGLWVDKSFGVPTAVRSWLAAATASRAWSEPDPHRSNQAFSNRG